MFRIITIFLVFISTVFGNGSTDVTLTCEAGVKFVKRGCFQDKANHRRLKKLVFNDRNNIDWHDWNNYLDSLSCECARRAKEKGYRYFGLQFYGECWSGQHSEDLFANKASSDCSGYDYEVCNDNSPSPCSGKALRNYVYEIVNEETETNICKKLSPCVNGECVSTGDSYVCECTEGYEGQNCEKTIDTDDCAGSPCINGECVDGVNSYECKCKAGYEGKNCEKNIDDCAGSPCLNGECIDGVNSYECKCKAGYGGKNCEKNIDDCAGSPCLNGECIDGVNSYECKCKAGYEGKNCEKNIDDCAGSPCLNGECIDGVNSYECKCKAGYEGKNCEKNIDDCAGSPCLNGECIDGVNSYECKCKAGYEGKNCEKNIDDCAGSPCINGECIDGVNSYECKCKAGYEGKNCENNIDDCAGSPCLNGECIDGVSSYECKCKAGYEGKNCEKNIDDCANRPCRNGGRCVDKVNYYQCICKTGYGGRNCETNIDDCAKKPCRNGGRCVDKVNSYQCVCKTGYSGRNCETDIDDCANRPCRNGGRCVDKVNHYQCICKTGYSGRNCETNIDDCAKKPCRNGGRCVDRVNSYQCVCKTGYGGQNCETNIDDCAKKPCRNGGRCVDKVNSYQCVCKTGFQGVNCETNINDCAKNPCRNGGKCVDKVNSYQCICKTGYSGLNCQTVTVKPSYCTNKNWWSSFDRQGWSTCANNKLFITGFYRNSLGGWDKDEIYRLEEAKCCSSNSLYLTQGSECKNANWWATLDRPNTWSVCPEGYFLNGLYRTSGNNLHNIEEGRCCKPVNHPKYYDHCYHEFIRYDFDKQGWTTCKRIGYYVAGVYRDHNKDWLHDIDYLKCCKMWTGTNQCASNPCVNGNCRNDGDSYQCQCKTGYEGRNCEKNIDDCAKKPCKHGTCVDKVNAYVCLCKIGYTGRNCDTYRVIEKPSYCTNKNWWSSFDRQGWSTCANDKLFITGFYRNSLGGWDKDEIYRLEEAKCCSSNSLYLTQGSECKNANWWATLDRPNTWSVCPEGYFLNGLYRTSGNNLHNIEEGRCCKPVNHPKKYKHCYHEFIRYDFDKQGWTTCKRTGYYVAGVYRDHNKDWLHDIDYLKCCKMWTGS